MRFEFDPVLAPADPSGLELSQDLLAAVHAAVAEALPADVAGGAADAVVRYLLNTARTTIHLTRGDDGAIEDAFVLTGDIPAMWLRDSSCQVLPLLRIASSTLGSDDERAELARVIAALLRRQWHCIRLDPYANAFNQTGDDSRWDNGDRPRPSPWVWERKFELDSLSFPPFLAERLLRETGEDSFLDDAVLPALEDIVTTFSAEQDHENRSEYTFQRSDCRPSDTLVRDGRGRRTAVTGMLWSGFRPSDDACELGNNVPGNLFAARALGSVSHLAGTIATRGGDQRERALALAEAAGALGDEVREAALTHAVVDGRLAYEVDGAGASLFMDDANVPSLLSLPYLGVLPADDPLYVATRAAVLSEQNPYFTRGSALTGVGSPHTPPRHVWPIALSIQGLTSTDDDERAQLLRTLLATTGGTGYMHEGVLADDPATFTRPWFSWSNAMFCELALDVAGIGSKARSSATNPV